MQHLFPRSSDPERPMSGVHAGIRQGGLYSRGLPSNYLASQVRLQPGCCSWAYSGGRRLPLYGLTSTVGGRPD